jgi:hypothetical protein
MPPHDIQQLGLEDHAVAVLDQVGEDVEHLWLDVHQLTAARQLVASGIQHTAVEPVSHRQICAPSRSGSPGKTLRGRRRTTLLR